MKNYKKTLFLLRRFGVCCLFLVSSTATAIDQNCTYIQNPGWPSSYSSTTSLMYRINKCSANVCSVRLDFETFTIEGPSLTTEATGGVCTDSFQVTGTSGGSSPVICGINTGEHGMTDIKKRFLYTFNTANFIFQCTWK